MYVQIQMKQKGEKGAYKTVKTISLANAKVNTETSEREIEGEQKIRTFVEISGELIPED